MPGEYSVDPSIIELMAQGPSPETTPDLQRLRDGIDKLPKRHRDVLNALFYERISKVELAERLNAHRTVVDRLFQEAIEALRLYFQMGEMQATRRQRLGVVPISRKPRRTQDGPDR